MDFHEATKKIDSLGDLSATMIYPLVYRAAITSRKSFLHDPFSVRLAKKFSLKYKEMNLHDFPLYTFRVVGRAYQFDQMLKRFLSENPSGTIVNIGAGLDTTFMRIDNGKLNWVDLDFPKVIALRKTFLPKNPRVHLISKSVLDLSWIEDIKKHPGPYFFLVGGVFMYITEKQTKNIIMRLAKQFPGSEIAFDPCTKQEVRESKILAKRRKAIGSSDNYKWGIKDPLQFAKWSPKIKLISAILCNHRIKSKYRMSKTESSLTTAFGEEVVGFVVHLKFLP